MNTGETINKRQAIQPLSTTNLNIHPLDNSTISNNFDIEEQNIRLDNLMAFARCCEKASIPYWLSNRTLLYAVKVGCLTSDRFDSVGIKKGEKAEFRIFLELLAATDFEIIKTSRWHVLLKKNNSYLEIDCYQPSKKGLLLGNVLIDYKFMKTLNTIRINESHLFIPSKSDEMINEIYINKQNDQFFKSSELLLNLQEKPRVIIKNRLKAVLEKMPFWSRRIINKTRLKKQTIKDLSEEKFLSLYFEEDPVNWMLRKPHLDLITCNGKYRQIGEIVEFLKNSTNLESVKNSIKETNVSGFFHEPIYFNNRFWKSGNNYFINCILYSFRKNVIPYENINQYLDCMPSLFTKEYYCSLETMSENEISDLLDINPIMVSNGLLVGGRHRVCAMIGRLVAGANYLPFKVLDISRNI